MPTPRFKRWSRFPVSLRVFGGVLVAIASFSLVRLYQMNACVSDLRNIGAHVYTVETGPDLLRSVLGRRFVSLFDTVATVSITDAAVDEQQLLPLEKCVYLRSLRLSGGSITDRHLRHIRANRTLLWMFLSDTEVSDAGCDYLVAFSSIEQLELDRTRVTDRGIERISKMTSLVSLSLADSQISDAGVCQMSTLTNLQMLNLEGTRVTDQGMQCLSRLPLLANLDVRNTEVTEDGVAALVAVRPGLHVDHGASDVQDARHP